MTVIHKLLVVLRLLGHRIDAHDVQIQLHNFLDSFVDLVLAEFIPLLRLQESSILEVPSKLVGTIDRLPVITDERELLTAFL